MVGGGVERCLLNLINAIGKERYNIDILAIKSGGDLIKNIPDWVGYRYIWKKEWNLFGIRIAGSDRLFSLVFKKLSSKILYRLFVGKKYDVCIDYWGQEGLKLVLGAESNVKKLAFIHTDMNVTSLQNANFPFKNHEMLKEAYNAIDNVICVSNDCRKSMIDRFGFQMDTKKVIVRYNINLTDEITEKSKQPIEAFDFSGKKLIAIGRLVELKGFERLIKICDRLKKDNIDFYLQILGQGPERENLENTIKELGLEDCVNLVGFCSNPYPYIANSDIFVCSSYYEGFSTVVSEAVILGIPVVTTDCTGAKEILGNSEYGVVTENDDESLYIGLKMMLTDNKAFESYKKAVLSRQDFFNQSKRLKETLELF